MKKTLGGSGRLSENLKMDPTSTSIKENSGGVVTR